jgi:hypothetical protein
VADIQLFSETDDRLIRCEEVVVELLQRPFPRFIAESGSEATGLRVGFEEGDAMTGVEQVESGGKARNASADDANV